MTALEILIAKEKNCRFCNARIRSMSMSLLGSWQCGTIVDENTAEGSKLRTFYLKRSIACQAREQELKGERV